MLAIYEARSGSLARTESAGGIGEQAVWIDLLNPTAEEEAQVEQAMGLDIPTPEEQQEIEASSRLYQEDGAYFMTASILYRPDGADPQVTPVTFILAGRRLVTLRYAEPRAFEMFLARCRRPEAGLATAVTALVGLVEAVVDRLADSVELIQAEVNALAHAIFEMKGGRATRQRRFDMLLKAVGREGEISSRARESLSSLDRLLTFLALAAKERQEDKAVRDRLRTAARDVASLADHVGFLNSRIEFLLDATLGMINIEQSNIIKIVSVVAVVFLPPTLVASIYGMNFEHMPELGWPFGYPFALVLMALFAVLPYVFFRGKGWL